MKKNICIVTGSRAEYGLLRFLIKKLYNNKKIELKLIVTGMHLSKSYGLTYKEILRDNIKIYSIVVLSKLLYIVVYRGLS